jgi:hypothetical protein
MAAVAVKATEPALSAKLRAKTDACVYKRILPAQEADGFWHYGFQGTDPKGKDAVGYFMVTAEALVQLQHVTGGYRDEEFQTALDKAYGFAAQQIAPMTDPNDGPASRRAGAGTPGHYKLAQGRHHAVDLGPEPAAAAAQRLGRLAPGPVGFFFAPAAATLARTQVVSALSHSVSSSRNSAATRAHTPRSHQRLYRGHRLFGLP